MLAAKTSVSPPISDAAARSASILRETSITLAPDDASVAAIALPIPFDAPVTNATLPSRRISMTGEGNGRGQVVAIGATVACNTATRVAGATSMSRPRRPPLTKIVAKSPADVSSTVGSGRFCPNGLIPPTT